MTSLLGTCPLCGWPVLTTATSCMRCERQTGDIACDELEAIDLRDLEVQRVLTGQMPSMDTFAQTQIESTALRRSEDAWRQAKARARGRHRIEVRRRSKWLALVAGTAVLALLALLSNHTTSNGPSSAALAWRTVTSASGSFSVDLPGPVQRSQSRDEVGPTERVSAVVGATTVAVSAYAAGPSTLGTTGAARSLLDARAVELGEAVTNGSTITTTRARWGDAYDRQVVIDETRQARLRALPFGTQIYLFEAVGPLTPTTDQIFGRVLNTFTPSGSAAG